MTRLSVSFSLLKKKKKTKKRKKERNDNNNTPLWKSAKRNDWRGAELINSRR